MSTNGRDPAATRSLRPGGESGPVSHSHFLVVQGDSSALFPLPAEGTLLIGRGDDADLNIHDESCSRRHARVIVADGEVRIADLDSHNGTRVNGERIEGARSLTSGDVVSIGDATLVLHRRTRAAGQRRFAPIAQFRERLEEEIERSLGFRRPLALVAVSGGRGGGGPTLPPRADAQLRLLDVVAASEDGQLLVLMPEVGSEDARARAEGLVAALAATVPGVRAGVATCPADGCDADALLESARAAAAVAPEGGVADSDRTVTELVLGERTMVLADPAMLRIFDLLRRLAKSELPVLISGETGAGKENAAYAVHVWSRRSAQPFVTLNCAALQETLVESELFGYEKGAFSGAAGPKPGLLETANGGTAFLDEVGELSASAQAKLLRALEARRITRLGSVREREIDIRIVAATNRNLEEEIEAGRFRRDLFFRLAAATVVLPPLRERPREVTVLARAFLAAACARAGRPAMEISPPAMLHLARYAWPGNVRELRNVMEYAAAAAQEDVLEIWHLPERVTGPEPAAEEPAAPSLGVSTATPASHFRSVAEELEELERKRMIEALEAAGGVKKRAAELIGMPLRTFVLKSGRYGLRERR